MKKIYLFTLTSNYNRYLSDLQGIYFRCEWGSIIDGYIQIKQGYSWDGCTCAINTKKTYNACLIHDFLCQFNPIPKEQTDELFLYLLRYDGFELSYLYFICVKTYHWTKKTIKKMVIFVSVIVSVLSLLSIIYIILMK